MFLKLESPQERPKMLLKFEENERKILLKNHLDALFFM